MAHGGKRDGAGRKPGVPNKISGDLKAMILGALERKGGEAYFEQQMEDNPIAFLALVGKLVPLSIGGDPGNPLKSQGRIEMVIVDTGVPRNPDATHFGPRRSLAEEISQ